MTETKLRELADITFSLPKPYYVDDAVAIYHADCRDILPSIPDKSIDLVLTDPDYNAKDIGPHHREYIGGMPYLSDREYKKWCKGWFKLARKVTDNLVFSCGLKGLWNYPPARWVLCWHKPAAVSYNRFGGYNVWEPILIYGNPFTRVPQDYLNFNTYNLKKGSEREHPCPKPDSLWSKLITMAKADLILDPFLGSGTTAFCAKKLGRKCIGIEIEEKYCEIAVKRLSQSVMSLNIDK